MSQRDARAGYAIYSPAALATYDVVVLRLANALVWRCPTPRMLALYDRYVADAHLDIGVGTGFYLDRCRFPTTAPRVGLMDANRHALDAASRRIARYRPTAYVADVCAPFAVDAEPFGSIAMTYLLHCLPGPMSYKARAFDRVAPLLRGDGVVFGATLLGLGVRHTFAARRLMRAYDARGIFSNASDSLAALHAELDARFEHVSIETAGSGALFVARGSKMCVAGRGT